LWIIYNLSNLCQDLGAAENFEIEVKSGLSYSFQLPTKCRLGVVQISRRGAIQSVSALVFPGKLQ